MNWKDIVKTVAPTIASALGGPAAGMGIKFLADKLLGDPNATEIDVENYIKTASPDDMLKLKQLDVDFKLKMKQLDIDVFKLEVSDRDSARKREIAVKDKAPSILAGVITIGFFAVFYFVFTNVLPEGNSQAIFILVGALTAGLTQVLNYYFGSSKGSSDKTKQIVDMVKK